MDKENVWPTELERLQEWGRVGLALHAACNAVIAMRYPGTAIDATLSPPTSIEPVQKVHELTSGEEMMLREAAQRVLDGLDRRIEAASLSDGVPIFEGLAELRAALTAIGGQNGGS